MATTSILTLFRIFISLLMCLSIYLIVTEYSGAAWALFGYGTLQSFDDYPMRFKADKILSTSPMWELSGNGTKTSYDEDFVKFKGDIKIILLWTPQFGDVTWGAGNHPEGCQYDKCLITNNRTLLRKADVILVHCREPPASWPPFRLPNQVYVVFCMESPFGTPFDVFNYRINLTATYRTDSDIYVPYGGITKNSNSSMNLKYIPKIPFSEKTKQVVWPVSNCNSNSKREEYVRELKKYIDVDVYGLCGSLECRPPGSSSCFDMFEHKYKFYLSFENSICVDYVTEKLFRPLQREIIPIVLGGANYSVVAPRNSVINVQDFRSPKNLADYLELLSNNATMYYDYFHWKTKYSFTGGKETEIFCQLCRILHTGIYRKAAWDVDYWWSHDTCKYKSTSTGIIHNSDYRLVIMLALCSLNLWS